MNARSVLVVLALLFLQRSALYATQMSYEPARLEWVTLQGSAQTDNPQSVAIDEDGNVLIAGYTRGDLGGTPSILTDAFVSKYNPDGSLIWTKHIDSGASDFSHAVSADGNGHFYLAGYTYGDLGEPLPSKVDSFVQKYSNNGELIWSRLQNFNNTNIGIDVSADKLGNVFTTGFSTFDINTSNAADAFVSMYDEGGNLQWSRELPIDGWVQGKGVAADNLGNVYVAGYSHDSFNYFDRWSDVFLSKYNATGELLWTGQFGSDSNDVAEDVAVDGSGGVYITGYASGALPDSIHDTEYEQAGLFVSKFDVEGNQIWTRQFGGGRGNSIAVDVSGNIYVAGSNRSLIVLGESPDDADAFVIKLDNTGNLLWSQLIGSSADENGYGIAIDGLGGVFVTGTTQGDFGDLRQGESYYPDMFVAKLNEAVPEPSTFQYVWPLLAAVLIRPRNMNLVIADKSFPRSNACD